MRGVDSRLALAFDCTPDTCQTRMRPLHQEMPQRVVRAFAGGDGVAVTHLHNLSGGVLGGDQLRLEVNVGPQAQAQLTTTGATRVYRHRPGPDASQQTTLRVARDALLEYLPDPLIPFAGSRYQQQVSIELAEGAGLFYWDILAPGREAYGEVFAFERIELALELCAGGEAVALERMELEPAIRPLTSPLRWGLFRYMATLYICRVGVAASQWLELENELATLVQCHTDGQNVAPNANCSPRAVWGVSSLAAHGLVVRALGVNGRQLQAGLVSCWAKAKERLYGRAAHLPRKLY